MMKTVAVVLMVIVLATAACADRPLGMNVREIMQGNVSVANPTLSTAWANNAAALAPSPAAMNEMAAGWKAEASTAVELSGSNDLFTINFGGAPVGQKWGVGVGYYDGDQISAFGGGFGYNFDPVAVGVGVYNLDHDDYYVASAQDDDYDMSESALVFDIGARATLPLGAENGLKLMVGAVARDVSDEFDTTFDAGVYARVTPEAGVGVDWASIGDDDVIRVGGTYDVNAGKIPLTLGLGYDDGNFTAGVCAGVMKTDTGALEVGLAWRDFDHDDDQWVLGATYAFGN